MPEYTGTVLCNVCQTDDCSTNGLQLPHEVISVTHIWTNHNTESFFEYKAEIANIKFLQVSHDPHSLRLYHK